MSKNSSFPKYNLTSTHPKTKHSARLLGGIDESSVDVAEYALQQVASVYECACLAHDVYYDANDPKRPPLPHGWVRFLDSKMFANPYFGACYIKNTPNAPVIVYAHRGTDPTVIGTVLNALKIANETLPDQVNCAGRFIKLVGEKLEEKYKNENREPAFINVGHSLGAVLSDFITMTYFPNSPSITFENPGSKKIIKDVQIKKAQNDGIPPYKINEMLQELDYEILPSTMRAYQGNVNLINSCNAQSGKTYRLDLPYKFNLPASEMRIMTENPLLNTNYLAYTLQQHGIDGICDYLKTGKKITQVDSQPVGFNQSYAEYLNYANRKAYWDDYQKTIWQGSQYIRNLFNNDEIKFRENFIKQLDIFRTHNLTPHSSLVRTKVDMNTFRQNKFKAANVHVSKNNIVEFTPEQKEKFMRLFSVFKRSEKGGIKSPAITPEIKSVPKQI